MSGKVPLIPDSRSKEFWGDSKTIKCAPETTEAGQVHKWRQTGTYAVCTSCLNHHGIFLDILNEEVRNGEICDIKTGDVLYGRERKTPLKTSNS